MLSFVFSIMLHNNCEESQRIDKQKIIKNTIKIEKSLVF